MACARVKTTPPQTAHDFVVMTNKGEELDLGSLAGTAFLVMHIASDCGYTKADQAVTELFDTKAGYQTATELWNKYHDQHFTVLAFPCDQFTVQTACSNEEIQTLVTERFNATFPIMDTVKVNGDNANEFWEFLKNQQKGVLGTTSIKWNFTSFLVDKTGNVVQRYSPGTSTANIEKDLLPLLL